jgi:hypothetical protein
MSMKWYNILTLLFYAKYGTTNFGSVLSSSYTGASYSTGITYDKGMQDIPAASGSSKVNNFWGIEGLVFAFRTEFVQNVLVDYSSPNHIWKITEEDGTVRTVTGAEIAGYISKIALGEHLDIIPTDVSATSTTGFCIKFERAASNNRVLRVALGSNLAANIPNNSSAGLGRLAFRGTIIEESDPAVFKSLTAIG